MKDGFVECDTKVPGVYSPSHIFWLNMPHILETSVHTLSKAGRNCKVPLILAKSFNNA